MESAKLIKLLFQVWRRSVVKYLFDRPQWWIWNMEKIGHRSVTDDSFLWNFWTNIKAELNSTVGSLFRRLQQYLFGLQSLNKTMIVVVDQSGDHTRNGEENTQNFNGWRDRQLKADMVDILKSSVHCKFKWVPRLLTIEQKRPNLATLG